MDLIRAAGPDDVGPFGSEKVHDWVNGFLIRAFGNDVVWEGSTFRGGQARPGVYLDREALSKIEHDEKTIITYQQEAYRKSIVGLAAKHLQEVAVPGEVPPANVTVVTAEQGESITTPLVGEKVEAAVANPKKEADDNLLYLLLGVGGFIGLIFATKR